MLALSASTGCGGADYGDPPGASGSQITLVLALVAPRDVRVEVVDDTPAGAPLRAQLGSAFDTAFETAIDGWRALHPLDPAAWHPVDHSLVVVHPSAVGSARFSSPATDPALRWRERNRSDEGHSRWLSAVHAALTTDPVTPGVPFQALAAFHDSATLLSGARPPTTNDEALLLASVPDYASVGLIVATEDQSPGPASQYTSDEPWPTIVPAAEPDSARACVDPGTSTPRYSAWRRSEQLWPCTDPDFFPVLPFDGLARCLNQPISTTNDGSAVCRITASYLSTEPCPSELGWIDPAGPDGVRVPRIDHGASGDVRVCEVQQLQGAALASCRSALDCAECEPGWCATEVPELIPNKGCAFGTHEPPFRFVRGADAIPESVASFTLTIVCDEATAG